MVHVNARLRVDSLGRSHSQGSGHAPTFFFFFLDIVVAFALFRKVKHSNLLDHRRPLLHNTVFPSFFFGREQNHIKFPPSGRKDGSL